LFGYGLFPKGSSAGSLVLNIIVLRQLALPLRGVWGHEGSILMDEFLFFIDWVSSLSLDYIREDLVTCHKDGLL
jgi:hypothetical protein